MKKRVLVIGASGYLGHRLMQEPFGEQMIGTFCHCHHPDLEFLDLCDNESILRVLTRLQPDLVLFAAGMTDVDRCQLDPSQAFQVNANAINTIAAFPNVKIVYFSTDYVFDGNSGYYTERAPTNPVNVYGQSKLRGEESVLLCNESNLVVRVSGLYGYSGVKGDAFERSWSSEGPVFAEDDRFSSPVHLDDVVSATKILLEQNASGIFHVAGGLSFSRYEFQQMFFHYAPIQRTVIPISKTLTKSIAPRPQNTSLSTKKISYIGWHARPLSQHLRSSFVQNTFTEGMHALLEETILATIGNRDVKAILIDCIGACLTKRSWKQIDLSLEYIDSLCGQVNCEEDFLGLIANQGYTGDDLPLLYELVTTRYAPNPKVWPYLRVWRNRYRLALVNNGLSSTFRIWVGRYGLDSIFDALVNSVELGIRKPHTEFFVQVAKLLNVHPSQCLLLDDDEANIAGARECGMAALMTYPLGNFPLTENWFSNNQWPEPFDIQ